MSSEDHLEQKALEALHTCMAADVQFTSRERGWNGIAASRFRLGRLQVALPALQVPAYVVNYGPSIQLERSNRPRAIRFKPGQLVILPPDRPTECACNQLLDVVAVCLSTDALEHAAVESGHRDPRSISISAGFAIRDIALERIAHQLLRELALSEHGARARVQARVQELAMQLVRSHSNLGQVAADRQSRTMPPHKLKRVKEFICTNLARDLTLAEVADVAEMTLFHFAKAFRGATGKAPHRYLIEHRILRARTLLHDPSLSISAVAAAVGFTHSHFTRLFTRYMGMTPSVFRDVLQA